MFLRDCAKFKSTVEETMKSFFNMTPEQVDQNILVIEKMYSNRYDLDKVDIRNVAPEYREIVMRYKTLKYFSNAYKKIIDLYNFLKEGEDDTI